ncbi:hypothetical protein RSAG8_00041, partial [Rhizoctonia solani AG-8 WAC10335]
MPTSYAMAAQRYWRWCRSGTHQDSIPPIGDIHNSDLAGRCLTSICYWPHPNLLRAQS